MGLFRNRPDPEYTPPKKKEQTYIDKFEDELSGIFEKYNGMLSEIEDIKKMPVPAEVKKATMESRNLDKGYLSGTYGSYYFHMESQNIFFCMQNDRVPGNYFHPSLKIENYNELVKIAENMGLSMDTKEKDITDKSFKETGNGDKRTSLYRFVEKDGGKPVLEVIQSSSNASYFLINADKKYISLASSILKLGQT
ncbi:MAG: hypothetical protein HZB68_04065 [Candidatus Aenigmarchaeota archaeon]|nr:hypothetical protein [Candidatus Aenigmarchaeota archaeon]